MTLKQLSYFLKIAEIGNLTKASQALNMSQPPLSYQLRQLEEELGVTLFVRESHSMKITDEGIYLQNKAEQILSLVDRTVSEISSFSKDKNFLVNIGTVTSSGHNFLPHAIKEFKELHPMATFNIYDGSSMRLQELLHHSIIDIAIIREPFPADQYESLLLKYSIENSIFDNDFFVVVGNKDHFSANEINTDSVELKRILNLPLVVHRVFEDILISQAKKIGHTINNIICRTDSISSCIEWASSGMGVTIMPYTSSLLRTDQNLLVKLIVNPSFYSNMYLIWAKDAELNKHTKAFIDMCKKR